ncbi:MAG TPA: hypothetical protein VM077_05670 [Candidatus Limnocylindrales bacterium]|nr:hypothetical protein [Candidatus Limnocylindrales bacterium]
MIPSEIKEKYEIVKLGNSHAEDGLTFEKYKAKSLSLASVAQSFEYDLAMLKMHSHQIKKNAVIVINVSPLSFSQKKAKKQDESNMNYYDGRLSPFLIPNFKASEYIQVQIIPFVRTGHIWREKISKDSKEKFMNSFAAEWEKPLKNKPATSAATILPEAKEPIIKIRTKDPTFNVQEIQAELNAPPDLSDERLVESMHFIYNKWYKSGDFDPKYFETNRQDLEKIVAYSLDHNWRPIFITIPISQVLINGLEKDYLKLYVYDNLGKIDLNGIPYLNFATNSQLTNNKYLFSNSDHLNQKGAAITSYLLLQQLIEKGYLPKEVDGYDYSAKMKQF